MLKTSGRRWSGRRFWEATVLLLLLHFQSSAEPVLFVTQTPFSFGDPAVGSLFGNHQGSATLAPRGGDLYIHCDDGTLRNLTAPLGYGTVAGSEICVRDPAVSYDGTKALFSMAIGGTTPGDLSPVYFQIYEITGILQGQTAAIRKIAQPAGYNNVMPCYLPDGEILFISDRPRNGDPRLFPLHDEYRGQYSNSGLWAMNADGSNLRVLDPNPSGDFSPIIDSFGRIIFTRWDHLERDQQANVDIDAIINNTTPPNHTLTYASETDFTTHSLAPADEFYPQLLNLHPSGAVTPNPTWDFQAQSDEGNFEFNHFFPWAMNPDGTGLEIVNHLGRHELNNFVGKARTQLPNFGPIASPVADPYHDSIFADANVYPRIATMMSIREDQRPAYAGRFYGVTAPEFSTHGAGGIVAVSAPLGTNAALIKPEYITYFETGSTPLSDAAARGTYQVGLFRDPMPRADGTLWAVHSNEYRNDSPAGPIPNTPSTPYTLVSRYDFRIKQLVVGTPVPGTVGGAYGGTVANTTRYVPGATLLASPISKTVSYFDNGPQRTVQYSGAMWELQPVSVVARSLPPAPVETLPQIEENIAEAVLGGVSGVADLGNYLTQHKLALVVSRDVTVRADKQQDFNLKVYWSAHQTPPAPAATKEIAWLQFVEADLVRGYGAGIPGRRAISRTIPNTLNPPQASAPVGAVKLGDDGSMAAFVPAGRALSWQTTQFDGTPSVRERYWVTFQPGEMRSCTNCHGLNQVDVFNNPVPANPPQALTSLLDWWKTQQALLPPPSAADDWTLYADASR